MKKIVFIVILICFTSLSGGEKKIKKWAKELSTLRNEINLLNSKINREKIISSGRLNALMQRKTLLEQELSREKAIKKEVLCKREELKQKIAMKEKKDAILKPVILEKIEKIKKTVKEGIPFRVTERVAALQSMKKRLNLSKNGVLEIAAELIRFIDDELKMGRETTLVKITVKEKKDSVPVLVDAVRLGMVELYTRRSESFGMFEKSDDGKWKFRKIENSQEVEKIQILFEAVEKHISEGFFTLPLRKIDGGKNE